MIKQYLQEIAEIQAHDDQREESFYPAVATLMTEFANSINKKGVSVTILPKKTEAGNPDFRIWDGNNKVVGYIEAKAPNTDLNRVEVSEQLTRYLETFPNVILTDFYEFRLYRNGEIIEKEKLDQNFAKVSNFGKVLNKFFDFSLPKIFTAESLALELAKRTRFLRDEIISIELQNQDSKNYIRGFYNAFNKYLIAGLQETDFADLYSQTVAYGMFASRTRAKENFTRELAIKYIPQTNGILRDVFEFISLGKLPKQMEVIIDDIAEVLSVSDATKLLNDYYKQGKGSDPIIHFYETFLNAYDPATREKRGVYYTPETVVKYIINSVDEILKKDFNKSGFADTSVKVLDPAGGTLTFLAEATQKAIQTFTDYFGEGDKKGFIKRHILKNFYGFELMMSPYAIAHLKMSYILQEHGYEFDEEDRFQLYLTNTLEGEKVDMPMLPGLSSLAEEAEQANKIRREKQILAVIGNPPYSFDSYNSSNFETELMKLYKIDLKNERNIKILSDDYIKFIRFAHWKIEQSGTGIVSFITKNTYLNIAAAKGMRKQLLLTFDKIYILNLHGKLYEKSPEGEKDQNVFDIRVGTAIMFFVKNKKRKKTTFAKLYYKDLYGERETKYEYLSQNNIFTSFSKNDLIDIDKDHFFFEPKNYKNKELYDKFWAIDEIFREKAMGVSSHRDHFVMDVDKNILERRLKKFINIDLGQKDKEKLFEIKDNRDFKVSKLIADFKEVEEKRFRKYAFKAFLFKTIYYDNKLIDYDRISIMHNFINKENIGLVTVRRQASNYFNFAFVTEEITDFNFLGVGSYTIPLWLYKQNGDAFNGNSNGKHQVSNLNPKIEELLEKTYNKKNITEQIFYYIYAILYSDIYRKSFPELLKIDYPKIPFPKTLPKFQTLAKLGKKLADLHLLKSSRINKPQVKFQGKGNGKIVKPKFIEKERILKINETQYFENISKKLWEFKVGKIQIIKQWINRKEKIEFEDAVEFSRIATAIYETFKIQTEIDKIYPEILNDLIVK